MDHRARIYCQTCTDTGRRGHCAPTRCYCGHEDCYAAASYIKARPLNVTTIPTSKSRAAEAWADRQESTWLDRL